MNWIWAIHEPFHLYQQNAFRESDEAPAQATCSHPRAWTTFLELEFSDWKEVGPRLLEKDIEQTTGFRQTLHRILDRRAEIGMNTTLGQCLIETRQGERIEGTARYADVHARLTAGTLSQESRWDDELLPLLTTRGNLPFPYSELPFFYSTGTLWCEALERLMPGKWQSEIEAGSTPEQVMRSFLGR
jgi:hypothetical protein